MDETLTMIPKRIKKLIAKIREWQEEHERDMEEWQESDPEGFYNFTMEQWRLK